MGRETAAFAFRHATTHKDSYIISLHHHLMFFFLGTAKSFGVHYRHTLEKSKLVHIPGASNSKSWLP